MTMHDPEAYRAEQQAKLARMAGQMADFFASYPEEQAVASIPSHINQFWSRKMREGISEQDWSVIGYGGSWLDAAERICRHLERKGIEVHR